MTRGLRSRKLIEPEPDPPVPSFATSYVQQGSSDLLDISKSWDANGKFLPGHPGLPGAGRPRSVSVTEILRKATDPQALAAELHYHAFVKHNLEAVTYIYDRLDGRPRQSLEVAADEGSQSLLERLVLAQEAVSRGESIEAQFQPPATT